MVKNRVLSSTFLGLTLFPAVAAAEGAGGLNGSAGDAAPQFESSAGSLAWVIVALLIVIGLIVLFIKFLASRNRGWGASRSLRSLGGVALGQNKSLQVVEAAGRIYVVGVGEDITLVDKITEPDAVAAIVAALEEQTGRSWNPATVTELWGKVRNRGGKPAPDAEGWDDSSFQAMLSDKLNRQADRRTQMESLLSDTNAGDRLDEK